MSSGNLSSPSNSLTDSGNSNDGADKTFSSFTCISISPVSIFLFTVSSDLAILSETEISKQIHKLYNLMKNNKYEYVSIDQFIEDFYEISKWNDVLQLGLDFNDLSSSFNDILFENYYNPTNELRKNIIDRFG